MATTGRDGLLLIDKPPGVTSHDVVATVRRARGRVRAGHTGTLDPFATGLLLVALGSATRLIRFIPAAPKVYDATIVFGTATDTDDVTGTIVGHGPVPDESNVRAGIAGLTGDVPQVPPDYSARHVDGRRAYALARAGVAPRLAAGRVTVDAWSVRAFTGRELAVTITCGAGTYVRALARDLGRACGTVAHLAALRRMRVGPFDVAAAVPPADAATATVLAPVDAIALPRQALTDADVALVRHGRAVPAGQPVDLVALVDQAGALVAVAERDGGSWRPRVVLAGD